MPKSQDKKPAFTWLSVNKEHIKAYRTLTTKQFEQEQITKNQALELGFFYY